MARESLVEDEMLDAQLDTLSAEEFVREVCRKIGHLPVRLPQSWDEGAEMTPVPPRRPKLLIAKTTDDWSAKPGDTDPAPAGRMPEPPNPDSSWPSLASTYAVGLLALFACREPQLRSRHRPARPSILLLLAGGGWGGVCARPR